MNITDATEARYDFSRHFVNGRWETNEPPYPLGPLLADLLVIELVDRGGSYTCPIVSQRIGAVSCLLRTIFPEDVYANFSTSAPGAATLAEKEGWIQRNYVNPITHKKQHACVSIEVVRQPDEQQLEDMRASRALLFSDLPTVEKSGPSPAPREGSLAGLSHRIRELERRLRLEMERHEEELSEKDAQIASLSAMLPQQDAPEDGVTLNEQKVLDALLFLGGKDTLDTIAEASNLSQREVVDAVNKLLAHRERQFIFNAGRRYGRTLWALEGS